MQFKEGTSVYSSDQKDVGRVDRVVLNPQTEEVTHIVIRQGFLFTEDKVIPIEQVASATEDRVMLRDRAEALNLPKFEETYFVPAYQRDDVTASGYRAGSGYTAEYPGGYAPTLLAYPPLGTAWWGYPGYFGGYPAAATSEVVDRNIPAEAVALKEGAGVFSSDNERVGSVERIFTDSKTDRATHFLISQGLIFTHEKLVPTSWISSVTEDRVELVLSTQALNNLPDYEA